MGSRHWKKIWLALVLCFILVKLYGTNVFTWNNSTGISSTPKITDLQSVQPARNYNSVTLQLAHGGPFEHPTNFTALEVAREIFSKTKGKIRLEVFGNMQLGQEIDLVKLVFNGKIDFIVVSTGALTTYNSVVSILDLPYLFNSSQMAYQAWDGEPGQIILKYFRESDLEGICYWENGLRSLTTSNRAVKYPEDLNNLHLRVMQNPVYISFFAKLGAIPTPLAWGEVIPSLQSGIIDSQENPVPIIYLNHLEKYQRYLILTKHSYNPHIVLASPFLTTKLSREEILLIYSIFQNARINQRRLVTEQSTQFLEELKNNGMNIINPDLTEFKKVGKEFSQAMLLKFPSEIRSYFERYLQ